VDKQPLVRPRWDSLKWWRTPLAKEAFTVTPSGNTIFIAGATSGIGLGLALRFHQLGNRVIISGRRKDLIDQIVADHPGIEGFVLDTADPTSIREAAVTVQTRFPDTNVLINMAGIMHAEDYKSADFLSVAEATVTTNLLGPIRLIAAFSEFLAAKADATIMNVSSGLAFVPLPITPTYNATKAAIHSLSEALRVQFSDTTIKVVELVPPAVQTALLGQENSPTSMPLQEFLDEVMSIIQNQPDVNEILVERVKFLRFAEATGTYNDVLALLSGH
jgi:uncharacterized oxidoreductase